MKDPVRTTLIQQIWKVFSQSDLKMDLLHNLSPKCKYFLEVYNPMRQRCWVRDQVPECGIA
jgi:hypothetical protein